MKSRLFFLILIAFVLLIFVSCVQQNTPPKRPDGDSSFEGGIYEKNPETGLYDFRGRDVTFVGDVQEVTPHLGASRWEDAEIAHIKKVEKDLNINLVFDYQDVVVKSLQAMMMSGVGTMDICQCDASLISSMYKTGIFADLKQIDAINLSDTEKYGNEAVLKFSEYNGGIYSLYGIGSFYWPENLAYMNNSILINDDLVAEFGAVHPLEYYEKEQWNFSTFKSYLPSITDTDVTHRIYALDAIANGNTIIFKSALIANGVNLVEQDTSGNYSFGYTSSNAFKALSWAKSIYEMSDCVVYNYIDPRPVFGGGRATMYIGHSSNLTGASTQIQQSMENLSYICFPYGTDVEFGSVTPSYYDTPYCTSIIRNGDEQEIGYVLDYLLSPMEGNQNGEYTDYLRSYFFTEKNNSFDLFMEQMRNMTYSYNGMLPETSRKADAALSSVAQGRKSLEEALLPLENAANAEIKKVFGS